jgi:hypothetical protein
MQKLAYNSATVLQEWWKYIGRKRKKKNGNKCGFGMLASGNLFITVFSSSSIRTLFKTLFHIIVCSYLFTGRKRATNPQPFRISKWAGQAESQTKSPYVLVWRRRRGIPQRMMTSISGDCSPPLPHSTARVLWRPVVTVLGSGPRIEVEQSVSACNP